MDATELVNKLLNLGNEVLEAASRELPKWGKLKHSKQDLEFFLQFNIVHLRFMPEKTVAMKDIVCTSNTKFIEVFSALKLSTKKKALSKSKNSGIWTQDPKSILTYNLLECKYNTIKLGRWEIANFLTITPDNIEVLDKFVNDLLKRPIEDDLNENISHKNKNKSK